MSPDKSRVHDLGIRKAIETLKRGDTCRSTSGYLGRYVDKGLCLYRAAKGELCVSYALRDAGGPMNDWGRPTEDQLESAAAMLVYLDANFCLKNEVP